MDLEVMVDDYRGLNAIVDGLIRKYPESSQDIFRFLARLTEEVGELAEQINHHYRGAVNKTAKHGEPDRAKLADEVRDVLVGALAIARFTKLDAELTASIARQYDKLVQQGFVEVK